MLLFNLINNDHYKIIKCFNNLSDYPIPYNKILSVNIKA